MSDWEVQDQRVKGALAKIMSGPDGDWQVALDLLAARGMRQSFVDRRKALGLSQLEVADRMGFPVMALDRLETDTWPDPHLSTMRRWALALEMEYRWELIRPVEEDDE